ncbi:hypothetical protein [Microbacterium excoecariae]|uniref:hypothetical protein n=1 Tax=Microbacterium excoecariae TaxID=2715210 RepID=UPI00140E761B|nr:hypothetical protein [Microbacterium excoecariae]NHI16543.1 hypothetical protein [Microbacterium excoecariae]
MTTARLCLYPWDVVGDPGAADRFAATGATGAAVASVYHSVRAATPRHPRHRVVDAASAAIYVPRDDAVWAGRRLRPREATPWAGEDAYRLAEKALTRAGLEVEPWVVLTHAAAVGSENPDVAVRNAFGDTYPYALCPTSGEVRDYAALLAGQAARFSRADRMMVEACGPLGFGHFGHHEKTQGADWSADDEALLSVCFCAACEGAYRREGADPRELRERVRGAVGDPARAQAALADLAPVVLAVRSAARAALAADVREATIAHGVTTLAFHAQPDPWATGPFAAPEGILEHADEVVLPGHDALRGPGAVAALRARGFAGPVSGYLNALPPATTAAIADAWPRATHLDGIYVYHAGLVSDARLDAVATALGALS